MVGRQAVAQRIAQQREFYGFRFVAGLKFEHGSLKILPDKSGSKSWISDPPLRNNINPGVGLGDAERIDATEFAVEIGKTDRGSINCKV